MMRGAAPSAEAQRPGAKAGGRERDARSLDQVFRLSRPPLRFPGKSGAVTVRIPRMPTSVGKAKTRPIAIAPVTAV